MNATTSSKFVKKKSAFKGLCTEYFKKNIDDIKDTLEFLTISKPEIAKIIDDALRQSPIKYNIKLEATYIKPNTDIKENRAFKTRSRAIFNVDDIDEMIELDFNNILKEQEIMALKGSGFSLDSIDGIILNINLHKTLGGASYLPLPEFIENKKATVNVQNNDNKCFKYSILAKHVNPVHAERIGCNYTAVEHIYDFSKINFPPTMKDISKFEKLNNVSVNVYSIKQGEPTYKNNVQSISKRKNLKKKLPNYMIYSVKVCEVEKNDHHDLLLFGDGSSKEHYCRITNFTKLVSAQLSQNGHAVLICKRCFKAYLIKGINRCGTTIKRS